MKKQCGFSIVELLVGLVIGLVILLGASSIFSGNLSSNMNSVKQQRIEQTVQVLMDMMSSDIRRAGYAKTGVNLTVQAGGGHYFSSGNCVLLSSSTATENERFIGYKLVNNVVYRYDGLVNSSCDSSVVNWSAVTDMSYIKVTMLWFDKGVVDLSASYNCSAVPVAGASAITRINLGVEAVGLVASAGTPVKRCGQINIHRRNA